ncbi:MAG: DNA mismatch repair protein MutS [SAR202 cluster bacterium Io17-Chloro-G7]|nr:MAG: DNA mismatch repair protein MutS [SAR202 cluster bacterium Io17-Chloro-G7]
MTPIRRQYLKIKSSYPDAIVLFRMGDFYETFDDDAKLAAGELEITLTSRSMGKDVRIPMAGVPAHSLDTYLARLVKKGHKVAICEQLTEPTASKGLMERDVVRVVTPGTLLEPGLLDQATNNYLAAVVEDGLEEGKQAGLAYVDISTGEFSATQLSFSQLPMELERIAAAEILVPESEDAPTWTENGGQGFTRRITPYDPNVFRVDDASQALLNHYGLLTLESLGCESMPLAVQAAGAIVEYLAATQKTGQQQLANLAVYSTQKFMALDSQTRRNLELFQGGRSESRNFSLLATLDLTKTPMGGRLLRQWLGQPLLNLPELEQRLDVVGHFFDDGFCRANAASTLARIPDLERILSRVNAGAVLPRELKSLQEGLTALPFLAQVLTSGEGIPRGANDANDPSADDDSANESLNPKEASANQMLGPLAWLARELSHLPDVVDLLERAIAPEPSANVGDGNVIRDGFSDELDELKRASRDARSFIAGLEQKERERTGIKNLRVGYNQVFGYYIEISKSNIPQVPEDYIRRQTLVNAERYIVPQLKEYESLVLNARERLEELEREIFRRVCAQIGSASEAVSKRAAAVARVDVFAGLAEVAVRNGYVRPQLNAGDTIYITSGRHPVVERVLDSGDYVANDVHLSNDDARVVVLTGPNMAGKSTYIRQVAIITLMAQIGSFVPASNATIGLVDRIFTRVGLQDDLVTGQSTFMVEMVETAAILNQATSKSLVILDEIGRGTSTYDGLSIARAVIEHIHNDSRLGCKTLFATHYHELTQLAGTFPGVRNFCVAVTEEDSDVVFLHRIVPGGADKSYGVYVARLAGLPRGVVNRAWEILADLEQTVTPGSTGGLRRSRKKPSQQMPLFDVSQPLMDEIRALDVPNLTPLEAINVLYNLQEKAKNQH